MAEEAASHEHQDPASLESLKAKLEDLTAQAGEHYSAKDYAAAADLYGHASAIQAQLNGELATQNAEILFLYGRSLYHVGVNNSDVLGAQVGGAAEATESNKSKGAGRNGKDVTNATRSSGTKEEASSGEVTRPILGRGPAKPVLQFQGDENWDEPQEEQPADEDAEEDGGDNVQGEDEDFTAAWESLDLARVLYKRQLEDLRTTEGKGKAVGDSAEFKRVKERLADTHDLLAEIALEHEQFADAVVDFQGALSLKEEQYPVESPIIAEAYYKLSLALEFASLKSTAEERDATGIDSKAHYDKAMRDEAAQHMEAAISSASARVVQEERLLDLPASEREAQGKGNVTTESVQEVKEIIADMEQRLVELRKPPVSVESAAEEAAIADGSHPLAGLLSSLTGASSEERKAKIEEVMRGANDLSGLVKHKKPPGSVKAKDGKAEAEPTPQHNGALNGDGITSKRKAEVSDDQEDGIASPAKRTKTQEQPVKDGTTTEESSAPVATS